MGTNFYTVFMNRPHLHIGKRSAAGPYCLDCKTTLCKGGNSKVHGDSFWHDECPKCGGKAHNDVNKIEGVRNVCSFTWAMEPDKVMKLIKQKAEFVDEYGDETTPEELLFIVDNCPIKFGHLIGEEFS